MTLTCPARSTALIAILLLPTSIQASVFNMPAGQTSLEMVTVGAAGNAADTRFPDPGHNISGTGAVSYSYQIGRYEVTIGQYTQFLNAVAATDTYGLYGADMDARAWMGPSMPWTIARIGSPGSYSYAACPGCENRPVDFVSLRDAQRFANWLTNGEPTGAQDQTTTEMGSYDNGLFVRSPGARYVIPTEDEWYKAAYYDPSRTGLPYWLYPTRSDTPPGLLDSAVPGPWGTFDQAASVVEWTESPYLRLDTYEPTGRYYLRGINSGYAWSHSHDRGVVEDRFVGFRIALVPEPAALGMACVGGICLMRRRTSR